MCLLGKGCRLSLGRGGRRRNPRGQWLRQTPCDHELRPPRERKAGHPQRAWRFPYRFANDKYSQLMRHPNRIFLSPYPYLSAWGVRGPPAVGGEGSAPALEGRGIYAELLVEGRREVARVGVAHVGRHDGDRRVAAGQALAPPLHPLLLE